MSEPGGHPVVTTSSGTLRGRADEGVLSFRGIPYAAPPVGDRRFRAPQSPLRWEGVRDATRYGPIAAQNPSPVDRLIGSSSKIEMSEDCLYLNVWTSGLDPRTRPVLVWIHGGAFVSGSGSTPWYDGSRFARNGDVVVVTLNYRLGAFGFLHLADVAGDDHLSAGNNGILDQVAALRWVRENIGAFGGDPANVTIFGESAGAMSVGTLLGAPAARGLFAKAILQSGAQQNLHTREAAAAVTDEFLEQLGAGRSLEHLLDAPVDRILGAQGRVNQRRVSSLPFQPVVDGHAVPEPPAAAVETGAVAGVPVLTGTTLHEMKLFTLLDERLGALDHERLVRWASEAFGGDAAGAVDVYTRNRPGEPLSEAWVAILTDQVFRMPAVRLAERQSRVQPQTFMYLFTYETPAFGGALRSCHALEIPFVFDNLHRPGAGVFTGDGPQSLADRMHRAWIEFARTGDPSTPDLPWPAYEGGRRATMLLGDECRVEDDPHAGERRLWEA